MGLLVVFGGLSLVTLASPTAVPAQDSVSPPVKARPPLHTHPSASAWRLPAAPRTANMPSESQLDRVEEVRSKERLPLSDAGFLLAQQDRKQGNTSLAMRVVGLSFGLGF